MIDINELRRLAQAATPGPWKLGQYLGSPRQFVIHMDVGDKGRGSDVAFTSAAFGNDETIANASFIAAANPAAITELLDRLEAAEAEALEEARLNGMGSEREAALMAKLEAAKKDRANFLVEMGRLCAQCDALRAKIEHMENQEPFDADSDVFRIAFESALSAGNWPATRQGDGYRSPSTQIAWRIAFSTVNRLTLYLAPGAKGEEK